MRLDRDPSFGTIVPPAGKPYLGCEPVPRSRPGLKSAGITRLEAHRAGEPPDRRRPRCPQHRKVSTDRPIPFPLISDVTRHRSRLRFPSGEARWSAVITRSYLLRRRRIRPIGSARLVQDRTAAVDRFDRSGRRARAVLLVAVPLARTRMRPCVLFLGPTDFQRRRSRSAVASASEREDDHDVAGFVPLPRHRKAATGSGTESGEPPRAGKAGHVLMTSRVLDLESSGWADLAIVVRPCAAG